MEAIRFFSQAQPGKPALLHHPAQQFRNLIEMPLGVLGLVDVHLRLEIFVHIFEVNKDVGDDAGDEKAHKKSDGGGVDKLRPGGGGGFC